jgi:hypothetical protein
MDLVQWAPVVYQASNRPGEGVPMLEVRAWLRCLFCGSIAEARTAPVPLNHIQSCASGATNKLVPLGNTGTYLDRPESRFHAAFTQLKQMKICDHCGFPSILPPRQAEELKKDMGRVITREWIEAQTMALLPAEPRLRTDLEQIVKISIQRALREVDLA